MRKLDTILVTPEEKANLDNAEHPLFYYHSKNQILENMADNIKLQGRMGQIDLRRNVHVDYLTRAFEKKKKVLQNLQNERHRYVNPERFKSILDNGRLSEQQQKERQLNQIERNRRAMYENFVQNFEEVQPKPLEDKPEVQIFTPNTVMQGLSEQDQRIVRKRENDLKLINRQISRIRMDIETDRRKLLQKDLCNNVGLIQKMSNAIISSYMVNFDEIFSLLIDDLLTQQVEYLNRFEENGKKAWLPPETEAKPISYEQRKLVDLLKQLDELGYDD